MMPRLLKLISDRIAKSKSHSISPLGQAWKRKMANDGDDEDSSGLGGADSHAAEQTARVKRPYEQLGEEEYKTSGSNIGTSSTEDVESAIWDSLDVRNYGELLEQRLNIGFIVPEFSYT